VTGRGECNKRNAIEDSYGALLALIWPVALIEYAAYSKGQFGAQMSYSDVAGHRSMVFDGVRNAAYARALAQVIRPGITVMDLGAGLGVHGLNAAKLGAAQVHLVEPSPVLEVARRIALANSLDNVHCHQCRVEELRLEGRVDVIVSVFTGNFLLCEDLLPSLFLARDRFLAPGGQMIPDRGRMEVVPVCAVDYYEKHIEAWNDYPRHAAHNGETGLDLRAARSFVANTLYYDSRKNFKATSLSSAAVLKEMDFTRAASADCNGEVEVEITQDGICHGWLGWFQIRLGAEWLSTSGEAEATHWRTAFLPLEQPLEVKAGERLGFTLNRPEFGEWTWTTRYRDSSQRQSTFLSRPVSPDQVRKASGTYRPRLGERGEAARWLLGQLQGKSTAVELASRLNEMYPAVFGSSQEAFRFVKSVVDSYSEI
jgi:hypothetical protein